MVKMKSRVIALAVSTLMCVAPVTVNAGSLAVSPVNIEVPNPGATSTIKLSNTGAEPINAQVRVFKWTQIDGVDQLVPTRDVVASPPALKLTAGKENVVRIVRLSKSPVLAEESYRLAVDELPKPPKAANVGVGISLRYSIPVFFTVSGEIGKLNWTANIMGGQLHLSAKNAGGRRVRLANLKILNGGKSLMVGPGLAGYVLKKSSKLWLVKGGASFAPAGTTIIITADGDIGKIEAKAQVSRAN